MLVLPVLLSLAFLSGNGVRAGVPANGRVQTDAASP